VNPLTSEAVKKEEDILSWLALSLVSGLGPAGFRAILRTYGSPREVLKADEDDLKRRGGLREDLARRIAKGRFIADPELEYMKSKEAGARIITLEDPEYPAPLKEIPDAPPVLYLKGLRLSGDTIFVAVVGSRTPTSYGVRSAEVISEGLAQAGVGVVSGLASGIDAAAHRGCLKAEGFTAAVVGTGIDRVYPSSNRELFEEITRKGVVISEFPMGTPPDARNFPRRNRIISGISRAVLVVEAAERSGSLITASMALEQGREVFAVPGSIQSPRSAGTHFLLKNGAALCEKAEDILSVLGIGSRGGKGPYEVREQEALGDEEKRIYSILEPYPIHVDSIIERAGLGPGKVLAILLALEMKGAVKQLPGKMFIRAK
jgi:DNA processing protein